MTRTEDIPGIAGLWGRTLGEPGVCIAVLDGPVDLSHPCFVGADLTLADVLSRSAGAGPSALRHGTHVASVLFGQHDGPVKGVAPRCRGLIIPIYEAAGGGPGCSQDDLARAIREAVRLGADVISISGGEPSRDGSASDALRGAILHCVANRRLIVAAAGNEGCERCLHVPGALPAVLAVGAMDGRGEPLAFSNWGPAYREQGVLAPGASVVGAAPGGGVVASTGTSYGTPIVSGVAALLLCLQREGGGPAAPFLARRAILDAASGCEVQAVSACDRLLAGRLNVSGAMALISQGAPQMPDASDVQGDVMTQTLTGEAPTRSGGEAAYRATPGLAAPTPPGRPSARGGGIAEFPGTSTITPAGCGCGCKGGTRQYVYAVGELGIDFGIRQRQDSLQEHYLGILPGPDDMIPTAGGQGKHPTYPADIGMYYNFLRHLLGYDFPALDPVGQPYSEAGNLISNGSLYDAASVYWILKQGDCPLYAIRPQGAFADQAYKQLIVFLIEQLGLDRDALRGLGIHTSSLEGFLRSYGGLQRDIFDPNSPRPTPAPEEREAPGGGERPLLEAAEAGGTTELGMMRAADVAGGEQPFGPIDPLDLFGEDADKASHVAIAGEVTGKVRLYSGEEVDVINPAMRGMSNWNTPRLVDDILTYLNVSEGMRPLITILIVKIVAKLYDLTLNPGRDPRDRARNYFATTQLNFVGRTFANPFFLSMLGGLDERGRPLVTQLANINVNDLVAKDAYCTRFGSDPYDVELSFYNFLNTFQGSAALAQIIDVSDIVPVASSKVRAYQLRR